MLSESASVFSHFCGSPPQIEQMPSEFNPPQEPDSGLLLKITPIDIPAIAIAKTVIPRKISMPEITGD